MDLNQIKRLGFKVFLHDIDELCSHEIFLRKVSSFRGGQPVKIAINAGQIKFFTMVDT